MTAPSTGDSSGDTSDIGDTEDSSWKNSFSMFVYNIQWLVRWSGNWKKKMVQYEHGQTQFLTAHGTQSM